MYPVMNRIFRAALAAVVVSGVVACAMGAHKTEAQQLADKDTADRVQRALTADSLLYSRHITVRADDGVVNLGGYVWTPPEQQDAIRIASSVPGVIKVVDRMEIDRGAISDSAVTR
jgi:osmotically-inducible protein OsmY